MNRKKQTILKNTLPLTTKEFLILKNRIKTHFVSQEKFRYENEPPEFVLQVMQLSLSQAPSSLESKAYLSNQKKRAQSIGPMLRIKKPTFSQGLRVTAKKDSRTKIQNFNLQRFRKIIHLTDENIYRTCEVDKRFRPKLFKKHH